jgi:hypothetical protein
MFVLKLSRRLKLTQIFSDHQLCQSVTFEGCPHHQGLMMGTELTPESSEIFEQLTRENFMEGNFNYQFYDAFRTV